MSIFVSISSDSALVDYRVLGQLNGIIRMVMFDTFTIWNLATGQLIVQNVWVVNNTYRWSVNGM